MTATALQAEQDPGQLQTPHLPTPPPAGVGSQQEPHLAARSPNPSPPLKPSWPRGCFGADTPAPETGPWVRGVADPRQASPSTGLPATRRQAACSPLAPSGVGRALGSPGLCCWGPLRGREPRREAWQTHGNRVSGKPRAAAPWPPATSHWPLPQDGAVAQLLPNPGLSCTKHKTQNTTHADRERDRTTVFSHQLLLPAGPVQAATENPPPLLSARLPPPTSPPPPGPVNILLDGLKPWDDPTGLARLLLSPPTPVSSLGWTQLQAPG